MFVFLSKFLPLLVYPLGMACILIVLGLVLWKKPRLQKSLILIALSILILAGNRWVAFGLTRGLESQYRPPEQIPQVEAIVVLGGGTEAGASPRSAVEVNGAGDRVIQAARLYREGVAPVVLLSGGSITWLSDRPSTPASEMSELMLFFGVPQDALWLQPDSQNTHEDALFSARILHDHGIQKIVLVTSAQHMPRSVALFEAQGLEVVPAPVDYSISDYEWRELWQFKPAAVLINLLPSAGNLNMTTNCLKEYLGIFIYRLQGWM